MSELSSIETKLSLKIIPNASKNEVVGQSEGVWRLKIAAPPEKGKANKELIEYLGELLGIKKDRITLLKGHTSRQKLVSIKGITEPELTRYFSKP